MSTNSQVRYLESTSQYDFQICIETDQTGTVSDWTKGQELEAEVYLNEALADLEDLTSMAIPPHILNKELKSGKYEYKYPHDYPGGYVKQQYLPDELIDKKYYNPKDTGSYERAITEYMKKLKCD